MISILLPTYQRPIQLKRCLHSLLNNSYRRFEILILDQNDTMETKKMVSAYHKTNIRYFHFGFHSKTKALNKGISLAKGDILAFIDDDCIAHKHWLRYIHMSFRRKPEIFGLFGNVLPYQPKCHTEEICPSTFQKKAEECIDSASLLYYQHIGVGNNMCFKKMLFSRIGNFMEWLGPGTSGGAAEEGDIIYRTLKSGHTVAFSPKVVVYHNRWLSPSQEQALQRTYSRGLMAFFVYYALKKDKKRMMKFIQMRIRERLVPQKGILSALYELWSFVGGAWVGLSQWDTDRANTI